MIFRLVKGYLCAHTVLSRASAVRFFLPLLRPSQFGVDGDCYYSTIIDVTCGVLGFCHILYTPGSPLTPPTRPDDLFSLCNYVCTYLYLWCLNVESIVWFTLFHVSQNSSVIRITYGDTENSIPNLNFRYYRLLGHLSIHPRDFAKMHGFATLNAVPNANCSLPDVQRSKRDVI